MRVKKKKKFRVQGSGFRVQGPGFWVQGSGFRVQGPGFRVQGSSHSLTHSLTHTLTPPTLTDKQVSFVACLQHLLARDEGDFSIKASLTPAPTSVKV